MLTDFLFEIFRVFDVKNYLTEITGMEHNFDIYTNDLVDNLGAEYEYTSCMHYNAYGFSINGEPTIVALKVRGSERILNILFETKFKPKKVVSFF